MPLIYRAANLVEAQLIGAIGELPPSEVIGVWLDEAQHSERARDIIDEFEAVRQRPEKDWRCQRCQEWVGREFGACWQCGQARPID